MSHIVPSWECKRINKQRGGGDPVHVTDGVAVLTSRQAKEHLLCEACEQRFSGWEKLVSEVAYQADSTFPLRDHAKRLPHPALNIQDWTGTDLSLLDTPTIVRFATSVLWRASVMTRPTVHLGRYQDRIRTFLLSDSHPLPTFAALFLRILDPQAGHPNIDQIVAFPERFKVGTYHVHRFAGWGLWFELLVGGLLMKNAEIICLARSNVAVVTTGQKITALMTERGLGSKVKGKLSR